MAYTHVDVIDWAAGVAGVPEVAAATAQRHDRAHSLTSSADHLDVLAIGAIPDCAVLKYNAILSRWEPAVLSAPGDAGGWTQSMMLMGG